MKPITPKEVQSKKESNIPPEVVAAFNELIIENWFNGSATVTQDDAVKRIKSKLDIDSNDLFNKGYLDVEPLFRKAGWTVKYDKPGYNETYKAYFEFSKR